MEKVVDSSRTATQRGLIDLRNVKPGNSGQQAPRLCVDALCVTQVASVMVGDAHRQRVAWRARRQFAQNLRDVFAFSAEGSGACSPRWVVAQQMTILLHGRTATGGIDDDGVHIGGLEGRNHRSRQPGGLFIQAGVQHERPPTLLCLGDDNLAALGGERSGSSPVYALKEHLLYAAGEHTNPAPAL